MYTQELINKVKKFRKSKLDLAKRLKKQGGSYIDISRAETSAFNVVSILEAYSCMSANSKENYSRELREEYKKLSNEKYNQLIELIEQG